MGAGAAIQLLPRLRSRWAEIRASRLRRRSEADAAVVWARVKSSCAWRFASSMSVGFELAEAGPWSSRLGSGVSSLLALSSWLSSAADFLPPKTTITPLAMSPPARAARTRAPDHLRFPAFRLHLHDLVPLEGEADLLARGIGLPAVARPWDRHASPPAPSRPRDRRPRRVAPPDRVEPIHAELRRFRRQSGIIEARVDPAARIWPELRRHALEPGHYLRPNARACFFVPFFASRGGMRFGCCWGAMSAWPGPPPSPPMKSRACCPSSFPNPGTGAV